MSISRIKVSSAGGGSESFAFATPVADTLYELDGQFPVGNYVFSTSSSINLKVWGSVSQYGETGSSGTTTLNITEANKPIFVQSDTPASVSFSVTPVSDVSLTTNITIDVITTSGTYTETGNAIVAVMSGGTGGAPTPNSQPSSNRIPGGAGAPGGRFYWDTIELSGSEPVVVGAGGVPQVFPVGGSQGTGGASSLGSISSDNPLATVSAPYASGGAGAGGISPAYTSNPEQLAQPGAGIISPIGGLAPAEIFANTTPNGTGQGGAAWSGGGNRGGNGSPGYGPAYNGQGGGGGAGASNGSGGARTRGGNGGAGAVVVIRNN